MFRVVLGNIVGLVGVLSSPVWPCRVVGLALEWVVRLDIAAVGVDSLREVAGLAQLRWAIER